MKYLILIFFYSVLVFSVTAQTRNVFNYQAHAVGADGKAIINTAIKAKTSIINNGIAIYTEVRNVTTNQLGLFTIPVGDAGAINTTANFATIDWATGTKAIKIEIDPTNNSTNFFIVTNTNLASVPYALYVLNGKVGPQGVVGNQGATGIQGVQGITGNTGPQGIPGFTGTVGNTGITGLQGAIGVQGTQGATGLTGATGVQGIVGINGKNTVSKTNTENAGANCTNGGQKIEYGVDANNNGILDAAEINANLTKYVCKGNDAVGVNAWNLTGNAGTVVTNFVGSTNQPLSLKMNNAAITTTNVFNNWVIGNSINANPLNEKVFINKGLSVQNGFIDIVKTSPSFESMSIGYKGISTSATSLFLNNNQQPVNISNGTNVNNSSLTVGRGFATEGTAKFIGTNYNSHINYSTTEDTYIRGGKPGSYVSLNTNTQGDVDLGEANGEIKLEGITNVTNGIYAKNYTNIDPASAANKVNIVPIGIIYCRSGMHHYPNAVVKRVPYIVETRNIYGNLITPGEGLVRLLWVNDGEYDQLNFGVGFRSQALLGYTNTFFDGSIGFYTNGLKVNGIGFNKRDAFPPGTNPSLTGYGGIEGQIRFPKINFDDFDNDMFIEFTVIVYGIKNTPL
jgi:Collagen triple helix repeat (20 copies)